MYIRNIMIGLQEASPGLAFGVEPTVQSYSILSDLEVVPEEIPAITSDVISFLHQHMGENMDYLSIDVQGTRYGLVGKGTQITPTQIDFLSEHIKGFITNEYNIRENNGSQAED